MKAFIGCLAILAIFHTSAFAQEYNIGAFTSIPLGDFAAKDIDNGGFASTGYGFYFETITRRDNWPDGLNASFQFSYQVNNLDGPSVAKAFTMELGSSLRAAISNTKYRPLTATLGPTYRFNLSDRFHINFKGGLGMMLSNIDPLTITVFDDQQNIVAEEEFIFESRPVFTYLVGLNLDYDISEFIGVVLFLNHSGATEKFTSRNNINTEQSILYLNSGVALSFKF